MSQSETPDLLPVEAVAARLRLPERYLERLSRHTGKISLDLLADPAFPPRGKLILVTATTPTVSGEGKTVTAIGLTQGLAHLGQKAIITSREPSLGPVFGMKGGAAGGGLSQVEPADRINLHFHGDFHAISSAHNLLAALIDAHLFHGNELGLDPAAITWPRALDMNDRALRRVTLSVTPPPSDPAKPPRDGANRSSEFLITAASEIMAILALASGRDDLRARLDRIVIGADRAGRPVTAGQMAATGPMMALLADAILPNLAQTTDGTPALVHCGPFANIAHGTSSVLSQQMGLRLADFVVNETGFASDLGFEKYMDIVSPVSGIRPSAAVLVTTAQSVRTQGEGELERGFGNLQRHIGIVRSFGLPIVVAINRFPQDSEAELDQLRTFCEQEGAAFALSEAYSKGGEGAAELARTVLKVLDGNPQPELTTTYQPAATAVEKIEAVARRIYGASGVEFSDAARASLDRFARWGFGDLPVCIAKTQYSFTDDPKRSGAPTGWTLHVKDVSLSAGAGFLVVISGAMMLMPGLPRSSRAMAIDVDERGEIVGMS